MSVGRPKGPRFSSLEQDRKRATDSCNRIAVSDFLLNSVPRETKDLLCGHWHNDDGFNPVWMTFPGGTKPGNQALLPNVSRGTQMKIGD